MSVSVETIFDGQDHITIEYPTIADAAVAVAYDSRNAWAEGFDVSITVRYDRRSDT